VPSLVTLPEVDAAVWQLAAPHLRVRNNDTHTLYAYGIARALLSSVEDASADVVLPAILLHDTGWSTVPEAEVLAAIAPGGGRPDLVRQHEVEGARIAREALESLGRPRDVVERVVAIIDGHDSRREALSIEDAVVKDADKIWRVTPHGVSIVCGWFGLTRDEALRLCASRVETSLFTEPGRAMARAFVAAGSIDLIPERQGLE
jgi:HD superfamily phosphodiesterase